MHKVFVVCNDFASSVKLQRSFHSADFEVCITSQDSVKAAVLAIELLPHLVVIEWLRDGVSLDIAEAIRVFAPDVPIFLIVSMPTMESEREALEHGFDAVFEKDDNRSLMLNAKAIIKSLLDSEPTKDDSS